MDSPLTGSLNQSIELPRVETNLFNLYIQGKPYHPTVESMQLHRKRWGMDGYKLAGSIPFE